KGALRDHLRRAEQGRSAEGQARVASELHLLAERVRFVTAVEAQPADARRRLEASCRSFWERRSEILAALSDTAPDQVDCVRHDLLDLVLFWADLRVSLAPAPAKNAAPH